MYWSVVVVIEEMEHAVNGQQGQLVKQAVLTEGCASPGDRRTNNHVSKIDPTRVRIRFSIRKGKHVSGFTLSGELEVEGSHPGFVGEHDRKTGILNSLVLKGCLGRGAEGLTEAIPLRAGLDQDL
jgi:hypothetical protein